MAILDNFILMEYIADTSVCDRLIEFFNNNKDIAIDGNVSNSNGIKFVDKDIKDSIDISLSPHECLEKEKFKVFQEYSNNLKEITKSYTEQFSYSASCAPWGVVENINLQYYKPGGGYKSWHTERTHGYGDNASRTLVWMTYLNDVHDKGETEFYHQHISVQPRKGLTLIWPADWTHTHRGIPSPTEEKYIITGWFNYI